MPRQSRFGRAAELPPRTRRIPIFGDKRSFYGGTTSAYAENTLDITAKDEFAGNYLRVRGEYKPLMASREACVELPPRTRRIPKMYGTGKTVPRTTSAYAENTRTHQLTPLLTRNYLRVRGEYRIRPSMVAGAWELPPRTRRIQHAHAAWPRTYGTTSAYAENTASKLVKALPHWNYLRVRGEYT